MPELNELKQRLSAELATAQERVQALQAEATESFRHMQERYQHFLAAARRLADALRPRIEAFVEQLKPYGATHEVGRLFGGPSGHEAGGGFVSFLFPHSQRCPATVKLRFEVRHDATIEHLLMEYDLEILPVFIQHEKHDLLEVPVESIDDSAVIRWFDDKLVQFTRTLLDLHFTAEYQRDCMVQDPVMGVTFPRPFAAGKREQGGRTLYFFTAESMREFDGDPKKFAVLRKEN